MCVVWFRSGCGVGKLGWRAEGLRRRGRRFKGKGGGGLRWKRKRKESSWGLEWEERGKQLLLPKGKIGVFTEWHVAK